MLHNEVHIFWKNLNIIQQKLCLTDEEFAVELDLRLPEFITYKLNQRFLPMDCLFKVGEKYNFYVVDLMSPYFSFKDSREVELADRYLVGQHSKMKPIINLIDYLNDNRGERAKFNLYRKFQLTEEYVTNPDNNANIHLITDIVDYLGEVHSFSAYDFYKMGLRTPLNDTSGMIKQEISKHGKLKDAYVHFVEEMAGLFDCNYDYRISKLSDNEVIIDSFPRKDVLEELDITKESFGSENACLTRMGVISSISTINYQKSTRVKKIKSLYSGDESNSYLVELFHDKNLSDLSLFNEIVTN